MASFLDHFPGSSLDARWTAVTSGTGAVTVTDSYARHVAPANSAAFVYHGAKLDKTVSQLWLVCIDMAVQPESGYAGRVMRVLNGASAPAAAAKSTIDGKTIIEVVQQSNELNLWHYNSADATRIWDGGADQAWEAYVAQTSLVPAVADDYYVIGLELDGENARWRMHVYHASFWTPGTWGLDQDDKQFVITDWVNWSDTRSNADLWLTFGEVYSDNADNSEIRVEWVRYCEAPAGNAVLDGWLAAKTNPAGQHLGFLHAYSHDGMVWLRDDFTTWALQLGGGGAPDEFEMNAPRVVYDGVDTDWMFYLGQESGGSFPTHLCVAHASYARPQTGTWTKDGAIVNLGSSGAFDEEQLGYCSVVKDENEADSNKRWKMLYAGKKLSDHKWRIGYATAPTPDGTWTKQGVVLDLGSAGAKDEGGLQDPLIVRYGGQWEVWYTGLDSSSNGHLLRAAGGDLASPTKDGTDYYTQDETLGDEALTANMSTSPGRTVTVADTSDFQVDASVVFSQSTGGDEYSTSRIRKITDGTHLELYHGVTGFTTTYPARVKQLLSSPNFSLRAIHQRDGEWRFYIAIWEPFANTSESGSYDALLEEMHLLTHSGTNPSSTSPTLDKLASPVAVRGPMAGISYENLGLVRDPIPSEAATQRTYVRFTGPAQLSGSAADLYMVGTGMKARILHIHASNPSGSPVNLTLSVGADAAGTRVYDAYAIPAGGIVKNFDPYDLDEGEKIQGFASSAGTVVLTITGWIQPA